MSTAWRCFFAVFRAPGSRAKFRVALSADFDKYPELFVPGVQKMSGEIRRSLERAWSASSSSLRMHRGESMLFNWPWGPVNIEWTPYVTVDVVYSIQEDGPRQRLSRVVTFRADTSGS